MSQPIIIDPKTRTVWETPAPPAMPGAHGLVVPGIGRVVTDPSSVFEPGISPWYFAPLGVQLGRMLIINPELPLAAVERMVTWVRALMVINDATLIVPRRQVPPDPATGWD